MPLTLSVDTARWRAHQERVLTSYGDLVPVAKGNGYGFGLSRLAVEAKALGVGMLAVGTYDELRDVQAFDGDLLVLTPWRPFFDVPGTSGGGVGVPTERLVHTVSRIEDLKELADAGTRPRVVLELLTSMRRHGLRSSDLAEVGALLDQVRFEGWALHLPLPTSGSHVTEVEAQIAQVAAAKLPTDRLFVSHLTAGELSTLGRSLPDTTVRPRVGTALWLGDRTAYRAHATVLDVHPVSRGDRFGYRQRRVPGDGSLVVVTGGTTHGIALEAPSHVGSMRERAKTLAQGAIEASGKALSPFGIGGQRRWFAEPPHMQVSLIYVPTSVTAPAVGDELDVNVGMTLTNFDEVEFS